MSDPVKQQILLESGTNEVEIADFELCGQHFGINVLKIKEFLPFEGLNIVPMVDAHPSVSGVFLLRDRTIPLVELDVHLSLKRRSKSRHQVVIVTEFNRTITAFKADSINRIHRASWEIFEPLSSFLNVSSVVGTLTLDKRDVLVLDLEHIVGEIFPQSVITYTEEGIHDTAEARDGRELTKIFFAEDSNLIRTMVSNILTAVGYKNIQTFPDGKAALDAIEGCMRQAESEGKHITDYVDILLTDIEMPRLDGLSLCKRVKMDHKLPIPVIIFSSLVNEQLEFKCDSVGASANVSKPESERLIGLIDKLALNRSAPQ